MKSIQVMNQKGQCKIQQINKKEKLILSDVDGVMLDWETGFHTWMKLRGYDRVRNGLWHIESSYNMPKDRAYQLLNEYNTSAYMSMIPPFRDARSGIAQLVEAGYRFKLITAIGTDSTVKQMRSMNIDYFFGKEAFIDLICVDIGADKEKELVLYKDSNLPWIEDNIKNYYAGNSVGLSSILMNHPYNMDDSVNCRVDNWGQIVSLLLS